MAGTSSCSNEILVPCLIGRKLMVNREGDAFFGHPVVTHSCTILRPRFSSRFLPEITPSQAVNFPPILAEICAELPVKAVCVLEFIKASQTFRVGDCILVLLITRIKARIPLLLCRRTLRPNERLRLPDSRHNDSPWPVKDSSSSLGRNTDLLPVLPGKALPCTSGNYCNGTWRRFLQNRRH